MVFPRVKHQGDNLQWYILLHNGSPYSKLYTSIIEYTIHN